MMENWSTICQEVDVGKSLLKERVKMIHDIRLLGQHYRSQQQNILPARWAATRLEPVHCLCLDQETLPFQRSSPSLLWDPGYRNGRRHIRRPSVVGSMTALLLAKTLAILVPLFVLYY